MDPFKCTRCDQSFQTTGEVMNHLQATHSESGSQATHDTEPHSPQSEEVGSQSPTAPATHADIQPEVKQTNGAGAPQGNQNALKFDTPEKRQAFCQAYCEHIATGRSDDSFSYQRSGIKVLRDYAQKFPIDFPPDMIEEAETKRFAFWETIGMRGAMGIPIEYNGKQYSKFNSDTYKFNMMNRFKWRVNNDMTSDGDKIETGPKIFMNTTPEGAEK